MSVTKLASNADEKKKHNTRNKRQIIIISLRVSVYTRFIWFRIMTRKIEKYDEFTENQREKVVEILLMKLGYGAV